MKIEIEYDIGSEVWVPIANQEEHTCAICNKPHWIDVWRPERDKIDGVIVYEDRQRPVLYTYWLDLEPEIVFSTREEAQAHCDKLNKE